MALGELCASPQRHDASEISAMLHGFSSSFGLQIKSIWSQWGYLCGHERALDGALWRKCRSGSTDLSLTVFCFAFPLLAVIPEKNMPYSICSQAAPGHEPPEPGTVSLGCQKRKERSCSPVLPWQLALSTRTSLPFSLYGTVEESIISGILIILVLWWSGFQLCDEPGFSTRTQCAFVCADKFKLSILSYKFSSEFKITMSGYLRERGRNSGCPHPAIGITAIA